MNWTKEGRALLKPSRFWTVVLIIFSAMALLLFLAGCGDEEVEPNPTITAAAAENEEESPDPEPEQPEERPKAAESTSEPPAEPEVEPEPLPQADPQDINEFFEISFRDLLMRNPELVSEIGLGDVFGTGNDRLTDISDSYIRETQALETSTLETLEGIDRSSLTPDQQLSYDIYEWYLQDIVDGHQWMYHDYPLTFFITSVHNGLELLMSDLHPVASKQDAEDYITRLSQVDEKFSQLLEGVETREEMGIIPPRFVIDWTLGDLLGVSSRIPRLTAYYTSFAEKVNRLDGLSQAEKQDLLDRAESAIADSVLPGYNEAVATMQRLRDKATTDDGAWKLPEGRDYYAYTLRHHTTTDLSADEIHEMGLQELERIQGEIRVLAGELGYDAGLSLRELYSQAENDAGFLSGADVVSEYESLIQGAENVMLPAAFGIVPEADVVVVGGDEGAYYVQPSLDGSRPGAFYARSTGSVSRMGMPTVAYHEALPGHHLQIAIARELEGLPSFRTGVDFNGYVEGWGLYAERLASELGLYEDDPYGDLGRLQLEAWRAARMVIDTGLHDKGWTYNEAVDFMVDNTGEMRPVAEYEVARYVVYPGQATSYMVGMLKILELRQRAMDALGDEFDLKEFHDLVLGSGSVPLEILEQIVDTYIQEKAR